jgi:hypothetical protein
MFRRLASVLLAGLIVLVALPSAPASAVPHPPPPPGTVVPNGLYHLRASYNGDQNAVKAWQITWTVPSFTNGDVAWGAVGQWFSNVEGGVYYTSHEGWWVYYYSDDNGLDGNNPECTQSWTYGGHCHGAMENLVPGQRVTFVYQFCNPPDHTFNAAGSQVCLFVNMNDGVGDRYLMSDAPRPQPEMYSHDIETFGDSGIAEPLVSCSQPTKMLGQRVRLNSGAWTNLTGQKWDFFDGSPTYEFRNAQLAANPSTWQTCSPSTNACPDPVWTTKASYVTGQQVYWNQRKWQARAASTGRIPASGMFWSDLGAC